MIQALLVNNDLKGANVMVRIGWPFALKI